MNNLSKKLSSKYQYVGFLPGSVRIKENGFWGMNDYDGNEILPSNFIELFTLSSGYGLIAARDAGAWDIYDFGGNKLNSEKYDNIYPYYGFFGLSKVKIGNKWGLLNKYGKIVIPANYQKIEKFGKGICLHKPNAIHFIGKQELIKLSSIKNYQLKIEAKSSLTKRAIGKSSKKTFTA